MFTEILSLYVFPFSLSLFVQGGLSQHSILASICWVLDGRMWYWKLEYSSVVEHWTCDQKVAGLGPSMQQPNSAVTTSVDMIINTKNVNCAQSRIQLAHSGSACKQKSAISLLMWSAFGSPRDEAFTRCSCNITDQYLEYSNYTSCRDGKQNSMNRR